MFTAFKILRNLIWGIVFCAKAASVTDVFETFAQIYIEYIENIDWTIYRWWRKQSSVSIGYYPILSLRSFLEIKSWGAQLLLVPKQYPDYQQSKHKPGEKKIQEMDFFADVELEY